MEGNRILCQQYSQYKCDSIRSGSCPQARDQQGERRAYAHLQDLTDILNNRSLCAQRRLNFAF